jgi:hypothetical protein
MKTALTLTALVTVIGSANSALAQYVPNYFYYGPAYSSTPYEGARRGEAAWIQAYGQFLEHQARAAQSWEHAYRERMYNRSLVYFARRERETAKLQARAEKRALAAVSKDFQQQPAAKRPAGNELSPTGVIHWPAVLRDSRYQSVRSQLDTSFAVRARRGYMRPDPTSRRQIEQSTGALLAQLRGQIRQIPTSVYLDAKGFVQRLANEARFPADQAALASNE